MPQIRTFNRRRRGRVHMRVSYVRVRSVLNSHLRSIIGPDITQSVRFRNQVGTPMNRLLLNRRLIWLDHRLGVRWSGVGFLGVGSDVISSPIIGVLAIRGGNIGGVGIGVDDGGVGLLFGRVLVGVDWFDDRRIHFWSVKMYGGRESVWIQSFRRRVENEVWNQEKRDRTMPSLLFLAPTIPPPCSRHVLFLFFYFYFYPLFFIFYFMFLLFYFTN